MNHSKLTVLVHLIGAVLGLTGALVALSACGSRIRYPNYYVLNVPSPTPEAVRPKPVTGSVAVREFSAPRFLRAGAIVYRQSPEQVGFYNYDRWAVDPRVTVTNAFVESLQSRGLFQSVHSFDSRGTSDYLVTGTLDHLEEVDQGNQVFINVAVSAQLLNLKTGNVIWRDSSFQAVKLDTRAVPGLVAGMSQAAEQAVTQLVSSMQGHVLELQASASPELRENTQE